MSTPRVSLIYSNGNLLQDIQAIDGIAGIVCTGSTVGLLGVPKVVYSLEDAISKGYTELAEPFMYRHLSEFYGELAGNQELYVMVVPDTMTLTQMLTNTNESGAKKLVNFADGKIRMLGVARKPAAGYDGGDDFLDEDVQPAVLAAKVFCEARVTELIPLRVLVEGRVVNPTAANTFEPRTAANGFAGVVLGGSLADGSASVGLALGRAVKYGAEIKLGKVANGPLSIATAYIGDKNIKDLPGLSALHGNGFISFMRHPRKAGVYFGIDRMASTDDYRLLTYGRVLDMAGVIAAAVGIEELESELLVNDAGQLDEVDVIHLEDRVRQTIDSAMSGKYSAVEVYINPAQDIITTGKLMIRVRVRPLGYSTFIEYNLGLNAPSSEN